MSKISFVATGDSFLVRRIPGLADKCGDLIELISGADASFTNLETVLRRDDEGFPGALSGGTWASSPPEVLDDLADMGFNMLAWANNHTLDYSYGGLEAMTGYLDAYGFVHAGVGRNLAEASRARYLETASGRVALIAATASFHEHWRAGEQRPDGPGRPGVNPLRHESLHHLPQAELETLRRIVEPSGVNTAHNISVSEGFTPPDKEGIARVGSTKFSVSEIEGKRLTTTAHAGDVARIVKSIKEAGRRADVVLVSIHAHAGEQKDIPAEFLVDFARKCVDAGAHAIIGHGPHVLRGIEIYKNSPIFYSLGNFIFHNDSVAWLPADFYEKYSLDPELDTSELLAFRSKSRTRGLSANPKVWHSVLARWEIANGALEGLSLYPIDMGFNEAVYRMGDPRLSTSTAALEEIIQLSEPFGTKFTIVDNKAVWTP